MKKKFFMSFLILVLIGILAGCTNNPETIEGDIAIGAYVMEDSLDILKPYVILKDNNEFSFVHSPESSYWAIGNYEEDDDQLILKTIDGEFKYVFQINDKNLIFNEKESSEIPLEKVPDGSIFTFNKDYLDERVGVVGIGYDLEYKDKIFPNMTESEIEEVIEKIIVAAKEKANKGETFKITEEELERLGIKGLDPQYLDKMKISTE